MTKIKNINGSNLPPPPKPPQKKLIRRMVKRISTGRKKSDFLELFVFERDNLKNIVFPANGLVRVDVPDYDGNCQIWIARELYEYGKMDQVILQ